jgi:hypothetical protein
MTENQTTENSELNRKVALALGWDVGYLPATPLAPQIMVYQVNGTIVGRCETWIPTHNNHQALKVMAELKINPFMDDSSVEIKTKNTDFVEDYSTHNGDKQRALRFAICRAAASGEF